MRRLCTHSYRRGSRHSYKYGMKRQAEIQKVKDEINDLDLEIAEARYKVMLSCRDGEWHDLWNRNVEADRFFRKKVAKEKGLPQELRDYREFWEEDDEMRAECALS